MTNLPSFSIAHPDSGTGDFYKVIKNTPQSVRDRISDIYFGAECILKFQDMEYKYGNVMDVYASRRQINSLFRIQEEFGIPISLTMNTNTHPPFLNLEPSVLKQFIDFIGEFYDRGLRMCTISNVHLIRSGILHNEFPEMKWKNTVNHAVGSAQEYIDYCELGYDIIQLDRKLNRDIKELEKIKKVRDIYGKPTIMLTRENCMPMCPFKQEHDSWNPEIGGSNYFPLLSGLSCSSWRTTGKKIDNVFYKLPRVGNDAYWTTTEIFEKYNELVDVFKLSGRYTYLADGTEEEWKLGWDYAYGELNDDQFFEKELKENYASIPENELIIEDYSKILEYGKPYQFNDLRLVKISNKKYTDDEVIQKTKEKKIEPFWETKQGKALTSKLLTCQNQCYDCHQCERAFDIEEYDTLTQLAKPSMKFGDLDVNYHEVGRPYDVDKIIAKA